MKKVSLILLVALGFTISCSDETTVYSDPQDDVVLEESDAVLENSIDYEASGVLTLLAKMHFQASLLAARMKNKPVITH